MVTPGFGFSDACDFILTTSLTGIVLQIYIHVFVEFEGLAPDIGWNEKCAH